MYRFLTELYVVVFFAILLQIQEAISGGSLQVTLEYYGFNYENRETSINPNLNTTDAPPAANNVTVASEYINAYKPQWNLSGIANTNRRLINNNFSSLGNITMDVWPWEGSAECSGTPQYRFLVCLDYNNSYNPERPCTLHRVQTQLISIDRTSAPPSVMGGESITFNNFLFGAGDNQGFILINPLRFEFPEWKEPVRISVFISCCGENTAYTGQCKEELSTVADVWPQPFIQGTRTIRRRLSGRGSLLLALSASCDPNYFRPSCDLLCKVDNPRIEHSFCNSSSGQKQCLLGWSGEDCQTDVDECTNLVCRNGGTCQNIPGSFSCTCRLGTRGSYCEQIVPLCHLQPCNNHGSCLDMPTGTQCSCTAEFTGQRCETETKLEATTEKSTTVAGVWDGGVSTLSSNTIKRSMISDKEDEIKWQNWYLAVILGGLFLVAAVSVIIILHQIKIRHDYKVSLSQSSTSNSIVSESTLVENNCLSNALYHVDDIILNYNQNVGITDYLAEDPARTTDANTLQRSVHEEFFQTRSNDRTIEDNDSLARYSIILDELFQNKEQFSPFISKDIITEKTSQRILEGKMNDEKNHQSFWEAGKCTVFHNPNLEDYQRVWTISSSEYKHSKKERFPSKSLAVNSENPANRLGQAYAITSVNRHPAHQFPSDENEYEEIDIRNIFKESKLISLNNEPTQENDIRRSYIVQHHNHNANRRYSEDENGYLTPRAVGILLSQNFNDFAGVNDYCPLSEIYDYPRNSIQNFKDSQNKEHVLMPPEKTQHLVDDLCSVSPVYSSSKTYIADYLDVLPTCESSEISPVLNSPTDEVSNPIYANIQTSEENMISVDLGEYSQPFSRPAHH